MSKKKNYFYMIIGPSGVGKGSIIKNLKSIPNTHFPVSYTTRDPREGEQDGQTYHFISQAEFVHKIEKNEFLEYALVHKKAYYGTDKNSILNALKEGKDVIREIDFQGYESVKELLEPNQYKSIYITAGDWSTLKERITSRSPISDDELNKRKESFQIEQKYKDEADYVITNKNGQLENAVQEITEIIQKG